MTPGVLTDLIGFLLLLPPTRWALYRWVQVLVARGVARGTIRMQFWRAGMSGGPFGGGKEPRSSDSDLPDGDRRTRPPRPGEIIQED